MTDTEALRIVEKYCGTHDRGRFTMPLSMKGKPEPEDFKEAADLLFLEWDFTFEYEEAGE